MSKSVYCRPAFWDEKLINNPDTQKYIAIQVPKDRIEVEEVFTQKYIDSLPENYVWKILASKGNVYRSNKDFNGEFIILDIPVET